MSTDIEAFRILGRVFSHAYICSGVLPDQLAFPCLAAAFLGLRVVIPELLLKRYNKKLCIHEVQMKLGYWKCKMRARASFDFGLY